MRKRMILQGLFVLSLLCMTGCQSEKENMIKQADKVEVESMEVYQKGKETIKDPTTEKSIVVYFSATGTTAGIAEQIAEALGTTSYEIIPKETYTEEDLDYNNADCRANQEMNNDEARPVIANDLSEVETYETIYLGYPVWWGTAPRIINTFMDTYNCKGKTIRVFCTSGSSGVEQSISDLQNLYKDVTILDGKRFSASASEDVIREWTQK